MALTLVDECIDIAKLNLDGGSNAVVADNFGEVVDDSLAAFKTSQMVVGQLENKEVLKNIPVDHFASFFLFEDAGGRRFDRATASRTVSIMKSIMLSVRPGKTPIQNVWSVMTSAFVNAPTTR